MTPDWHKIGIVSKSDFDNLNQKVDVLISNQSLILESISNLEMTLSKALKTQGINITGIKKAIQEIKNTDLQMLSQEIERVEQLTKLSLINNVMETIESK